MLAQELRSIFAATEVATASEDDMSELTRVFGNAKAFAASVGKPVEQLQQAVEKMPEIENNGFFDLRGALGSIWFRELKTDEKT